MLLLLYIWAAATIYLILFYGYFHLRLLFRGPAPSGSFSEAVSVVICAHNEATNLRRNLPKILTQKNVHFEVLVVNDRSTDETAEVLARFKMQYPNLTIVENRADPDYVGKKKALLLGLENARHDYFVLTDADCEPYSDQWLSHMASGFNSHSLVLGVSPYKWVGGITSGLTQWETLLTAQNYLSFALAGLPYMGVGRNMAYSRSLFESSDRFSSHLDIPSGDDDLFVGQVATSKNSGVEMHPDSFTWSEGPADFKSWWRQKKRHLSTSGAYKPLPGLLLGGFGLSQLMFYTALIPLLIWFEQMELIIGLGVVKFSVQLISLLPAALKLRQSKTLWLFPLWEFLTVVLLALIHLENKLAGRSKTWN